MTAIPGISAFYHDSAAALIVDGRIVAAAQEERFTRKKHDPAFPAEAVRYCLAEARLQASDLDFVAFYEKPLVKFERLLETYLAFAPSESHPSADRHEESGPRRGRRIELRRQWETAA